MIKITFFAGQIKPLSEGRRQDGKEAKNRIEICWKCQWGATYEVFDNVDRSRMNWNEGSRSSSRRIAVKRGWADIITSTKTSVDHAHFELISLKTYEEVENDRWGQPWRKQPCCFIISFRSSPRTSKQIQNFSRANFWAISDANSSVPEKVSVINCYV